MPELGLDPTAPPEPVTPPPPVSGTSPDPTPVPAPEPTPTPEPTPEPPPADLGVDVFGVTMLHPTKAGGEAWSLAADATRDPRFDPKSALTRNADGSWKIQSNQVRLSVFTSTGYDSGKIPTYDRDVLAGRGYMQAANDWKNVEMTGFVKLNAASDMGDNFDWYARGGRHTDSLACEGSSYKGALHYDGRTRWQKETWHVSYEQASYKPATRSLEGRWVGFKAVMRNTQVNGREAVRLELYLNDSADKVTWQKIYDMVDAGGWGGDATHCGGATDAMPITWGGPIAVFRWDNASDVDFKWLSIREIEPE
ncbi:carbohydrate-binding protein [Hyalangium sp.]|uniref:carbohydrate-binding protein n=1 Tax=Hyalangium sp. TaxID=2028555 RepID=UPI0039C8B295